MIADAITDASTNGQINNNILDTLSDCETNIIEVIQKRKKNKQRCDLEAVAQSSEYERDIVISSVERLVGIEILRETVYGGRLCYNIAKTPKKSED